MSSRKKALAGLRTLTSVSTRPDKPEKDKGLKTATKTRCCALGLSSFPPVHTCGIKPETFRTNIEDEVAAVSEACRGGSRFLELQLRLLLLDPANEGKLPMYDKPVKEGRKTKKDSDAEVVGAGNPEEQKKPKHEPCFPIKKAVTQAIAAMQKGARPQIVLPGYKEARTVWKKIHPHEGVRVQAPNSLTYASNAFYDTLLSNYTKIALPRHVFWTLRHLLPERRQDLKDVLLAGADVTALDTPLPADMQDLITECQLIENAKYSEEMACRAIQLRWECLRLLDMAGPRQVILRDGTLKSLPPKKFTLVPQCRRASRFITLDRQWANRMLGLDRNSQEKKDPLFECFSGSQDVKKWCRKYEFPSTVKTDGVQLHVPFETQVPIGEHPDMKDVRSCDSAELLKQLDSKHPHGFFHLNASEALGQSHPSYENSVAVDPGVKNLVTTDTGVKITRGDFYGVTRRVTTLVHPRQKIKVNADGEEVYIHSRATRRNQIPRAIQKLQEDLQIHGLASGGRDHKLFVDNLTAWLKSEKDLRTYYGSRTQRTVRLMRAARARRNMAGVVNLVAPDPKTVVLFGANFFGRHCRQGDVAGPVAVKGIRRALAKQRVVISIDEFNTTKCHLECGQEMVQDPDDRHEKVCNRCRMKVDRDMNAARNIKAVWQHHLIYHDGTRPAHLTRPARLSACV